MAKPRGPTWAPRDADYRQVFQEQNPWWSAGQVPQAWAPPVERPLARLLGTRLLHDAPHRFQLVLGPRRVGKTTTMYQAVKRLHMSGVALARLWWLRLDHPLLMRVPLGDLVRAALAVVGKPNEPLYRFLD